MDIHLGENNSTGIDLGNIIDEKYKIPFIYLTAYDTGEIISQAIKTKPTSYITKPFKNIDLLASVEIALSNIEDTKENQELKYLTVKDEEFNIKVLISDINILSQKVIIYSYFVNQELLKLDRLLSKSSKYYLKILFKSTEHILSIKSS